MKKMILIDGNSLMFRAYYATAYTGSLMQNTKGLYTNAIFGFCNMISSLDIKDASNIFVAFDAGKETFRHKEYDQYKGTRKPMPEEFRVQIPYIKKYLDILKIKRKEMLEFEADDLIASVATKAYNEDFDEIVVLTGDKDLLQLVNDKIKVFLTKRGLTELDEYNVNNFKEKMGFSSTQLVDYKGLVGDASDNLPGIKGIGDKTAIKLLEQFNSLENIITNVQSLSGKTKQLILENQETGLLCKRLATLEKNILLDFSLEDTKKSLSDINSLKEFYRDLEFYSFLKKIDSYQEEKKPDQYIQKNDYIICEKDYDFSTLKSSYIVSEVYKDNYYNGELLGLGIISEDDKLFVSYDVIIHNHSFKEYMESNYPKNVFDYKKIYVVLKKENIFINNVIYDGLLATYLVNPSYASEDVKKCLEHFSSSSCNYNDTIYGANKKLHIPDIQMYSSNCIFKCELLKDTKEYILEQIKKFDQEKLLQMELNLSVVLGDMEISGLLVDTKKLQEIGNGLEQKSNLLEKEIYEMAHHSFNINSVKQLGEVLFEELQIPHGKKNKTGYSTSVEVLEKLAHHYEIVQKILDYRAVTKLLNTYINGLFDVTNDEGYIHPLYKQALTLTGRLSSVEPNIQNMPIRTDLGQVIREVFISRFPNGLIMSADYSQIELRVLAHMSDDQAMINAFCNNYDFHTQTASWLYDVNINDVTTEMRRTAKAINFGIVYGMSAWGLSESINISPQEASNYITKYFITHYKIKNFLDETIIDAKKNGYTKTLFNRLRYINELQSSNHNLRSFGERTAMNSPIQGTAADIIKIAMVEVHKRMQGMKSILIAQVHDELVFDVCLEEKAQLEKIVQETMENVCNLKVPLIVKVSSGENWLKS